MLQEFRQSMLKNEACNDDTEGDSGDSSTEDECMKKEEDVNFEFSKPMVTMCESVKVFLMVAATENFDLAYSSGEQKRDCFFFNLTAS
jgi:hypothetical protein